MALNDKQQSFVQHYLTCWNATKAALLAGYSEKTAYSQGSRLLKNVEVQAAIEERMKALTMSADEVLYRLSQHAQGDVTIFTGLTTEQIREHPQSFLIKEIEVTSIQITDEMKEQRVKLKIHDPQAALVHIGRHHKLFTDKHEHTGRIEVIDPRERLAHLLDSAASESDEGEGDREPDAAGG